MGNIQLSLATANGHLQRSRTMIEQAIATAQSYAFPRLSIDWDIDVIITDKIHMLIPENGAGGYTYAADLIRINIDEQNVTADLIAESAVHEFCHAARWGKNPEWINSLFDCLIFEGIAVSFEAQFVQNCIDRQLFIQTILTRSDQDNQQILSLIRDQLNSNQYDYDTIFFHGDDQLPRWAGYSLGFYLVQKYLKATNKTIENAFADPYMNFRISLS